MRRLEFRDTTIRDGDAESPFSYRGMVLNILRRPKDPQNGATIEEQRLSGKIIGLVMEAPIEGPVVLEDADWQHLKEKAESFPFAICAPEIADFLRSIVEAEEVPQNALQAIAGAKAEPGEERA